MRRRCVWYVVQGGGIRLTLRRAAAAGSPPLMSMRSSWVAPRVLLTQELASPLKEGGGGEGRGRGLFIGAHLPRGSFFQPADWLYSPYPPHTQKLGHT